MLPNRSGSLSLDQEVSELVKAILSREADLMSGSLVSVIYFLGPNSKGELVSGLVDVLQWLNRPECEAVLSGKDSFLPCTRDLSFMNLSTMQHTSNNSTCFARVFDRCFTLRCVRDGSILDPNIGSQGWSKVTELSNEDHKSKLVIFDRFIVNPVST